MTRRLLTWTVLLGSATLAIKMWPELKRYLKIRRM